MSFKYKLCALLVENTTRVQPIDEGGKPYLDTLCTYEDNEECYAIYENTGDDEDEEWEEYQHYGQDFEKARAEYLKLKAESK